MIVPGAEKSLVCLFLLDALCLSSGWISTSLGRNCILLHYIQNSLGILCCFLWCFFVFFFFFKGHGACFFFLKASEKTPNLKKTSNLKKTIQIFGTDF